MRLLMIEARVVLDGEGRAPLTVAWGAHAPSPSTGRRHSSLPSPTRKVVSVVDSWRYDGRWWEQVELRRDYYLLELDGGTQLELFQEGGAWWAARASD